MRFRPGVNAPESGFQAEGLLVVDPGDGEPVRSYGSSDPGAVPSIRARRHGDRLLVTANGPVETAQSPTADAALASFANRLAGARPLPRPAPTAWCSWYRYFESITPDDIRENVAALDRTGLPVDVVQIDDGWSAEIGDWTRPAAGFGSLATLAAQIRETGRRAGIWIAPFTVGRQTTLAAEHPDWLVGDGGRNWNQPLAGLDLTHPAAQEFLSGVLHSLRDAGFDYFKLDFLYCGALPGTRYQDASGIDAYRLGLELVRDAVGYEAYLVGCGAPLLPSIGVLDGMRVSPDTFHEGGEDGRGELRGAAGALARAWQHGRWWTNDSDCFVGRPSFARRAEWAEVIGACGGLRSISDRINELDEWGLRTAHRLLSSAPGPRPFEAQGLPHA